MLFNCKKNKGKTIEEKLLNYMKEKYNEEFTPGLCQHAGWASTADEMSILSDKFPGEFIDVERSKEGVYSDNYLSFLYREETDRRMQEVAERIYGKCKVLTTENNYTLPPQLDKNTPYEEYIVAQS